ncbi:oxidoreductase [Parapedobacter koreensis]|uniref:NADP-dependent 3-hydroxy acid dehydrogenase YdfG n=1 Tax=Parapedobacter koreensis TaxID=332977 RepID=A0A1H7LRE1_9SPHI|nr:oxidoreductase [Parapedobacter koreensis]SEL01480.1 NADP-dependent 3-hydroxy acid dehydrogenase YdfG [Parapedobacter koreensis]
METTQEKPVWFITGCSTGFGRELVKQLLEQGYRVAVTARNTDKVRDLVAGYEQQSIVLPLDVTEKQQVKEAIAQAEATFGGIDVLVNNAGFGYFSSIEEGEDEKIRAQFETNVFGLIQVTQAALPGMRRRRKGHIVNLSSIGGLRSFGATGFYHATKYAVEGLSETLSIEVAPLGIKVLLVEPGPFRTDWAGRSSLHTSLQIADYEPTVGVRMTTSFAGSGKQKGDPARGAEAIIKAVESDNTPLRLLLGKAAYELANGKLDMLKADFDAWKDVTIGADFPDSEG